MPTMFMYQPTIDRATGRWIINEVCTCGCLMTLHEKVSMTDGHGKCTYCATCEQFTWYTFVYAKTP